MTIRYPNQFKGRHIQYGGRHYYFMDKTVFNGKYSGYLSMSELFELPECCVSKHVLKGRLIIYRNHNVVSDHFKTLEDVLTIKKIDAYSSNKKKYQKRVQTYDVNKRLEEQICSKEMHDVMQLWPVTVSTETAHIHF